MNLSRLALLLFAMVAAAATAEAQFGVYGAVTVDRLTGFPKCSTCGITSGTTSPVGGTIGAFYEFRSYGPVRLGADIRGSETFVSKSVQQYSSYSQRIESVLGGVRGSVHTPLTPLRAYVQGSVGMGRTNIAGAYSSGLEYRVFAGADLALAPMIDFRVVELGTGAINVNGSYHRMDSISSGVVIHFGR